jgi:hypothetical protein
VERADIAGMVNALRESFLAAGKDIEEKRTATGSAFFTAGHAVGQYETRANVLRARLWLADKDRQKLEARPTFDADSGWLHVVSDEDVTFVRGLVATAYRSAASGSANAVPSSPRRPAGGAPWTVGTAEPERKRVTPTLEADTQVGEKKRSASRRPPSRI